MNLVDARTSGRLGAIAWSVLMVVAYSTLYVAAFVPWAAVFVVALAAVVAVERRGVFQPMLAGLLRRAQLSAVTRSLIRDAAVLVLVARSDDYGTAVVGLLTIGLLGLCWMRALVNVVLRRVAELRQLPHPTRNLDLTQVGIPDAPPTWLSAQASNLLLYAGLPTAVGAAIDALAGTGYLAVTGLAGSAVVASCVLALAIVHHRRNGVLADKAKLSAATLDRLREYQPEILLYFSLSEASGTTYQVDSWLSTLEGLRHRAAILVRERKHVNRIASTHLPIISMPRGPDVMNLSLPTLKAVLYVGNTGNNIHLLRTNGVRHIFVGHGDSDKVASTNPFSRVYDEVWVAGQAGRDRYRRAGSAVADSSIVEVGRPQLAVVEPPRTQRRIFTVLYAPTWEGWSTDLALSSLPVMGVKIVQTLLALSPDVRIIYKPHPLTGHQDQVTKRINQSIIELLDAANARRAADPAWSAVIDDDAATRTAATARIAALEREIQELTGPSAPDDAQAARDNGTPDLAKHARLLAAERELQQATWEAAGWWAHRTVTGPRPDLYSCFNQADMMIADISAVVSDFVASGKPYVVTNINDQDEAEFRAAQTVAGGAYLLDSTASGLADLVQALQQAEPVDPMAARRERLRHYLLGPSVPEPMVRFNDAVDAVIAKPYPTPPKLGDPLVAEVTLPAARRSIDGEATA
ncbi:MAG TPA: hypothetical protein VFO77_11785, partial [Actinoplanes sp.]|nr:hypothetical protein [Actinoplanes sp.]